MAQICYGCFKKVQDDDNVCPYCGYRIHEMPDSLHILKPGTILNQKYTIGKTLGEGGFGITYLAWDNNMQIKIAIKEFYPANLVARDTSSSDHTQIYTITQSGSGEFHQGLERFVREASTLAQFFNLPGIVSVKDFFYENRTAYRRDHPERVSKAKRRCDFRRRNSGAYEAGDRVACRDTRA